MKREWFVKISNNLTLLYKYTNLKRIFGTIKVIISNIITKSTFTEMCQTYIIIYEKKTILSKYLTI